MTPSCYLSCLPGCSGCSWVPQRISTSWSQIAMSTGRSWGRSTCCALTGYTKGRSCRTQSQWKRAPRWSAALCRSVYTRHYSIAVTWPTQYCQSVCNLIFLLKRNHQSTWELGLVVSKVKKKDLDFLLILTFAFWFLISNVTIYELLWKISHIKFSHVMWE